MLKISRKMTKGRNDWRTVSEGQTGLIRLGPPSRNQEWVLGEVGEEQAVIIDGTSAELQVSPLMRVNR